MKTYIYLITLLLFAGNSFAQGHFVVAFTGNGQDHMNINVVTATIGGVALEAGDEIAAFDGAICCGKITLTQPIVITIPSTFAIISASRKDDGLLNGYTIGNAITYKFWDASKGLEFTGISAEYFDNTGTAITAPTYSPNSTTFVKLTIDAPVNQTPVSNAGPDQAVNEGGNVILDGSASFDADANPLTYAWTSPPGIILSSTSVAKPTFTAPNVTTDTQYTFSLIVNDGLVNSGTDQVVITVKKVNLIPLANAGVDQTANEGVIVTLNGTASSDPDSDPLTYLWTSPTVITLSSNTSTQPTFTAPEVNSDTQYTFSLVVNDGTVNSTIDQVIITVKQVNKAPVANAGTDQSVNENIQYTLDGSTSSDPDGDALTYKWTSPAGITLSSLSAAKPTFTAPDVTANTNYTFTLVVNDGKVDSPADQVTITVEDIDNAPYVKDPIKDVSVDKRSPNQVIDLRTVFADNDLGDVLSYIVSSNSSGNVVAATITGFDLTLIFSTENTGLAEIEITATSNGKEAKSKFKVEVKIPTGINSMISNQKMLVYPNPTSGKIKIVFEGIPQNGNTLTVTDETGKTILKKNIQYKEEWIDLKGNPPGLYLIKSSLNKTTAQKVIFY